MLYWDKYMKHRGLSKSINCRQKYMSSYALKFYMSNRILRLRNSIRHGYLSSIHRSSYYKDAKYMNMFKRVRYDMVWRSTVKEIYL